MTVKCLNEDQKNFIAAAYRENVLNTEELALQFDVSKRTINRVTVELGVNKVRHYKPRYKDNSTMELPITMVEVDKTPAPAPQPEPPFYQRLYVFVKSALSFPFK